MTHIDDLGHGLKRIVEIEPHTPGLDEGQTQSTGDTPEVLTSAEYLIDPIKGSDLERVVEMKPTPLDSVGVYCTTGGDQCDDLDRHGLRKRLAKALWKGAVAAALCGPDGEGLWDDDDDSRWMRKLVEELGFETVDVRCASGWALKGDPEWDTERWRR